MYKRGLPLWKIGNELRLIPAQSFIEKDVDEIEIDLADRKEILGIAASRLIKTAALIAENAARGIFPSNKNLKTAITTSYKRRAGRPHKAQK
jgi:hypothetical protein